MKPKNYAFLMLTFVLLLGCLTPAVIPAEELTPITTSVSIPDSSSAATVSGTIRHNGAPVPNVTVHVIWDGASQEDTTAGDGSYNISGVPTGSWIQIFVRPAIASRLEFRNWGNETLTGNLVKDFDLESGFRLQGEIRDPNGTPYTNGLWLGTNPITDFPPEGEWVGDGVDESGNFDMVLRPGLYRLKGNAPPFFIPKTTVNLQTADQAAQIINLIPNREPVYNTTPPQADMITVGDLDEEGIAQVVGTPGAVEPFSAIAVINLSASTITRTISDEGGAFSVSLFAPPGSSLLVKHDPDGENVNLLWRDAQTGYPDGDIINPLPGTILHVGELPPGNLHTQSFHQAGAWTSEETAPGWVGWWITGTLETPANVGTFGLPVQAGETVTVTAELHVTSPAMNCVGSPPMIPIGHVFLQALFGEEGHPKPWGIWFNAHLFTPTGLPIEHEAGGQTWPGVPAPGTDLSCTSTHTFKETVQAQLPIPVQLPDGIFLPRIFLDPGDPASIPFSPDIPLVKIWYHFDPFIQLPPLSVGTTTTPHIPWTLLGDYPVNGHRGVGAQEDDGVFAMPTRVLLPPHRVVVPRLDARTGEPLSYRLEPGSHWLSATDRRQPNPPFIPLALPSGALTVQVQKPDGSIDTLGPAVLQQSAVRTPTTPGGSPIDHGTGHIADLYHLSTMDENFAYTFDQYGDHVITLDGEVYDIYGNVYPIAGTYDLTVARVLDLDPGQLPTTPYTQGDYFSPNMHIFPPVPAEVSIDVVHMPFSDPNQAVMANFSGFANRFGYFHPPPGTPFQFAMPGEFRVDISARYLAPDGTLWMGAMTWGNVVENANPRMAAHGRRGMDYHADPILDPIDDMPFWFKVFDLPPQKVGIENYYPYFSGDVHWGNEDRQPGDSIHSIITVEDLRSGGTETIYNAIRNHFPRATNCFRWPPDGCDMNGLNERIAINEAPLFITTQSGVDPGFNPDDIAMWGYWYGSSERPDVRVREIISEDGMGTAYWRFDDTYGYQIGEGAAGDLPGDLKWEFGGAVLRVPSEDISEYAVYSSLWVLLPHGCETDIYGCARVTPPFRGAGALDGGPIMTLLGEDIDMLFLPKGVRPGDILELGDTFSFSGHVGPPLDSRVSITMTSPSQSVITTTWHANKVGWLYDPTFDRSVDEIGRWRVEVSVLHDRVYEPTGMNPNDQPFFNEHNSGTVLGLDTPANPTYNKTYEFYVVSSDALRLQILDPQPGFITWPHGEVEPIEIQVSAPTGTTDVHYTIHDKGAVMGQGTLNPLGNGAFTLTYNAKALNEDFPFLSLTAHEGHWEGLANEVAINLLAIGGTTPQANTVTLIGEEIFIGQHGTVRVSLPAILTGGP